MFLSFLEYVVSGIAMWLWITQIVFPIWRGTQLFPLFRKEAKLWDKLSAEKQATVESELESDGGKAGGGAMALVDLLTAKTARDIGVDLSLAGREKTK